MPSCLVTTNVPSGRASTIGKPTLARSGIDSQSNWQLPPEHCAPHSMMWPATVPAASRSQSSRCQPNSWISGASVSPVSVARPVMTTRAPRLERLDHRPRAEVDVRALNRVRARSESGSPVSMLRSSTPRASSSSRRSMMSSPVTTPILSFPPRPSSRATSRTASAQPARVDAAGVGRDADVALDASGQDVAHERHEVARVARAVGRARAASA